MTSTLISADVAIKEVPQNIGSDPGLVHMGIQAAFPNIHWAWLRWVLDNIGVSRWLGDALFATYHGSEVKVFLHGQRIGVRLHVARSLKQGWCEAGLRCFWQLVGTCMRFCLRFALAPIFVHPSSLATLAWRFGVSSFLLRLTLLYLILVLRAVGSALHFRKTAVFRFGRGGESIEQACARSAGARRREDAGRGPRAGQRAAVLSGRLPCTSLHHTRGM